MAASSAGRSWRTAFLTLRDEILTPPPRAVLLNLLRTIIFSQSQALVAAAHELPPREVSLDLMLLVELVSKMEDIDEVTDVSILTCHLIHGVNCRVRLEVNSTSWLSLLDFLEKMVQLCFCHPKSVCPNDVARMKAIREALDILRNCLSTESAKLVKFLLQLVSFLQTEISSSHSSGSQQYAAHHGTRIHKGSSVWEVQAVAFSMLGDILSRMGSSLPADIWKLTLEILRKVMDILSTKGPLVEVHIFSRFYASVLQCLHVILSDPKGSLSDQVAGFVSSLQRFFTYGLSSRTSLAVGKEFSVQIRNSQMTDSGKNNCGGRYRPPHLRKRESIDVQMQKAYDDQSSSDHESSGFAFASSDSEHSDTDGSVKDIDLYQCSKARIAALVCIQDLCEADSKSLAACLPMLLPTSDVLQPRKSQATLLTCLLFDPILKVRLASASALTAILDGSSSVCCQVAEYKEPAKYGSFTSLSSTLGQILMQLHSGLLFLIEKETHNGLLQSLFKALTHLISATPYSRMPAELLPRILSTLDAKILEAFTLKTEQTTLLASSLSCLNAALSVSPPSLLVAEMLLEQRPSAVSQLKPSLLPVLFKVSQQSAHTSINYEALQALRAAFHNYPSVMTTFWEQVSCTVSGLLHMGGPSCGRHEVLAQPWKGEVGNTSVLTAERCLMAAIKVLDECLRASSGFKGMDGLPNDELLDTPFLYDCDKTAKISSAPCYGFHGMESSNSNSVSHPSGAKLWSFAIKDHLTLTLSHSASMVRAASVTCFAGMTSNVYFLLAEEMQDFVVSSITNAALKDEVPSVRSAACRAIGIISCFREVFDSAVILDGFVRAVETNTCSTLLSVRITASWALANICDSLRRRASYMESNEPAKCPKTDARAISLLAECALRLATDNDKVKSNAVRALGNLARFANFTPQTTGDIDWLERMVQAFVSCVTTGNVKVQWNVCHSLGYLFLNDTLRLPDLSWAPSVYSILLLLLRDSANFKIRINAAAALAVPTSRRDYGSSFSDVLQGLELILENIATDRVLPPSSFKYKPTLERQLTSTTLHVLGLASSSDPQLIKDFLTKKAAFLEEWLSVLCSSLVEESAHQCMGSSNAETQNDGSVTTKKKKTMISAAVRSLVDIYRSCGHQNLVLRFDKLTQCLS